MNTDNLKLGTHNSLSYHKPMQWWLRPFAWMARCQDLSIREQWKAGVRYFDIRVKYDSNGVPKSGHGLMTYDVLPWDILGLIEYYASRDNEIAIVRLFHENDKRNPNKHRAEFYEFCQDAMAQFSKHIIFVEGGCRYDYKRVISDTVFERVCYAEYYKQRFCIPWPKRWAKKNNHRLHRGDNVNEYSIYDFVEL